MSARPYLAAFWGPRREPVEECARRLERWLAAVKPLGMREWYLGGRPGKPKIPLQSGTAVLVERLLRGRNRNDVDHAVIEELGFSTWMWDGSAVRDSGVGFNVDCGGWSEVVLNHFNLDLPVGPSELLERPRSLAILNSVVEAWDPDWAVVLGDRAVRASQAPTPRTPFLGWLTYLSPGRGDPGPIKGASVERLANGGSVILLASRLEDVEVDDALRTAETLRASGVLRPTPTDRAVIEPATVR